MSNWPPPPCVTDPREDRGQHLGGDRLVERDRGRGRRAARRRRRAASLPARAANRSHAVAREVDRGELLRRRCVASPQRERRGHGVEPVGGPVAPVAGEQRGAAGVAAERGGQLGERGAHRLGVERRRTGARARTQPSRIARSASIVRGAPEADRVSRKRGEQLAIRRAVGDRSRSSAPNARVECDLVGDLALVEQPARAERVLDQDPVAEPVDRVDRRVIERGDRGAQPGGGPRRRSPTPARSPVAVDTTARDSRSSRSRIPQPELGRRPCR